MKILGISIEKETPEYVIYQVEKTSLFRKLFGIAPVIKRFKRSKIQTYAHFSKCVYFNEKGETLLPWDEDVKTIESWRNRF